MRPDTLFALARLFDHESDAAAVAAYRARTPFDESDRLEAISDELYRRACAAERDEKSKKRRARLESKAIRAHLNGTPDGVVSGARGKETTEC